MENSLERQKIIEELAEYGIDENEVYLIDIIPLIEMIWADNRAQPGEITLLEDFLKKHVVYINKLAGYELLTYKSAREFALRFLDKRPDAELIKLLRSYVEPLRLSSLNDEETEKIKSSLLAACLDIAASSVKEYPYGIHDRFDSGEKKCFFEILKSLNG